jgi:4-amino-4-deoxy-L-arabinose transferase-like glycosyltransferase
MVISSLFVTKTFNRQMKQRRRTYLFIVIALASFLSLWNKGQHDLQEWDESRNGVNAYEMLKNNDYVNLYYNNKLDTWNAKPPLMIWLITFSYKAFGFNEFALRFPSTISTILFFILCFYFVTLFETDLTAFLTSLILMSGKSILGNHIGLTGDFDGLLVFLLTASAYTFIVYVERQKKYAIYLTALFTGLAFYTKGPASFVFIPGFILYALFRKKGLEFLKDKNIWFSGAILVVIVFSWLVLVYLYGKTTTSSVYGSNNAIETMLIHDTFRRLTVSDFDNFGTNKHSYFFFFEVLDARLNLWNYMFYLILLCAIILSIKTKQNLFKLIREPQHRSLLFSFCLIIPLSLVLTASLNQHDWYLAPIFMFVALVTSKGIEILSGRWKPLFYITISLLVFTLARQFYSVYSQETTTHHAFTNNKLLENRRLIVIGSLKQDILLHLKWLNVDLTWEEDPTNAPKGELVFINKKSVKDSLLNKVTSISEIDNYYLGLMNN